MRTLASAVLLLVAIPVGAGFKVEAHGRPVPDATVTILLESKGSAADVFGDEPIVYRTDSRGMLPFELPRASGAIVIVDHELYAPVMLAVEGGRPQARVTLNEGVEWNGRVAGDGHAPLGPGKVCAIYPVTTRQNGGRVEVQRCGFIAADGTWTLRALPAGGQRLEVEVPAYLPLTQGVSIPAETWSGGLDPGLRAQLHVADSAGRPAAGATVMCDGAVPTPADGRGIALVSVSRSGAKCRALAQDGAESRALEIDAPSTSHQTLQLRPARIAEGALITSDASDPAALRFTLLGKIGETGQSATRVEPLPGSPGTFRIRLPEEGPNALRVEAAGMLPVTTGWFTLPPGGGTAGLGVISLRRGAGVSGRVVDAATQLPLAGATVSLETQGRARLILGSFGKASTMTDSDGSFTVAGVGIGSYRMRVAWGDLPPIEHPIDLHEEAVVSAGTIACHQGVQVAGTVVRNDGEPLSAARVELVPWRLYDNEALAFAYTDGDGAFGPIVIAPGTYRLVVRGDDVLWDQELHISHDEESMNVDVRIQSTRLTGVIREKGVPVTGGEVLLQRLTDLRGNLGVAVARNPRVGRQVWSGRPESNLSAIVNGVGLFAIGDAPAGQLVLEYLGTAGERVTRSINVSGEMDAFVTVDIDGWALQGRVDDGELESGLTAHVELVDNHGTTIFRGTTSAAGSFVVERLMPGTYALVASADGYRSSDPLRITIVNEAPSPVRIRLARTAEAALDLDLKRPGAIPAPGVAVSIVDAVGRQLRASSTWIDGKLHVRGLPAGIAHIIWSDPLAGVGASPPIQLRPGTQQVSVLLEPGKDLVVRCETADCSGSRLGSLAFTNEHGIDLAPFLHLIRALVYSETGAAYLGRLAPGHYGVTATSGTFGLDQRLELGSGPGEVALLLTRRD